MHESWVGDRAFRVVHNPVTHHCIFSFHLNSLFQIRAPLKL